MGNICVNHIKFMFIIFGWGKQIIKNIGPVFKNQCTSCGNEDYWQLLRITTWFTLFWIPVIPYGVKYFLMCPICEHGVYLEKQKYDELKILAENNSALIKGTITQAQYISNLNQLNSSSINTSSPVTTINTGDCSNCKQNNPAGTKFCKNCGARL